MSNQPIIIETRNLEVRVGKRVLLRGASFCVPKGEVLGLLGPSGAGKSTLLRCVNRLNDFIPGMEVRGDVLLGEKSVYAPGTNVNALRERIGMLFQQPVIFPTTVEENVLFGAKRLRSIARADRAALVESVLREAALWEEVKDRLRQPANVLSVGQQQRLCLARALAVQPDAILMDEPTSALDPRSTAAIEELLGRLKLRHAIVLVTHNIAQARRVADSVACICVRDGAGEIVEQGRQEAVLNAPGSRELADYLSHAG
jgi:phosphate transport system ATP-binding protein